MCLLHYPQTLGIGGNMCLHYSVTFDFWDEIILVFNISNDNCIDCILSHSPTIRLYCARYTQTLQPALSRYCLLNVFIPFPLTPSFFFYWSTVAFLYYIDFCCTAQWISYTYTYIHSSLDFLPIYVTTDYWLSTVTCAI